VYWPRFTRYEAATGVMGRKRFDHLGTYICMNNNSNIKQKDEPG